jgi:hypothetical protein
MSRGQGGRQAVGEVLAHRVQERGPAASRDGGGLVASGVGYQRATLQPGMGRLTDDRTPDATSACRR